MSEIFNFEKSPVEELRDLLPGTDGFDFGTRPHGLPADLPEPHQETPEVSSLSPSAKPVLTSVEPSALPDAARTEEHGRPASCGDVHGEYLPDEEPDDFVSVSLRCRKYYPLVFTAAQMEHAERAISLAIQDAVAALEEEPDGAHEIQPDLDAYNQLYLSLQACKAAYKDRKASPNEGWRGNML